MILIQRARRSLAPDTDTDTPPYGARASQPETPHTAMQQVRTGEHAQAVATQIADGVIEMEIARPQDAKHKVIDVTGELAALN